MVPHIEIQHPHIVFYPVDECEIVTNQRAVPLVRQVFQLAFATVCDELIQHETLGSCTGCAVNHPSRGQHLCLMMDNGEACFLYFDQAMENIALANVMTIKCKEDHRSCRRNFCSCEEKA